MQTNTQVKKTDLIFRIGVANEVPNILRKGFGFSDISLGHAFIYSIVLRKDRIYDPTNTHLLDPESYLIDNGKCIFNTYSLYPSEIDVTLPSWRHNFSRDFQRFQRIVLLKDGFVHETDSTCFIDVTKEQFLELTSINSAQSILRKAQAIRYDLLNDNCIKFASDVMTSISGTTTNRFNFNSFDSTLSCYSPFVLSDRIKAYNNQQSVNLDQFIFDNELSEDQRIINAINNL